MLHHPNKILSLADRSAFEQLAPHLAESSLPRGEVLAETERHIAKVYFPHSGVISCVVELAAGGAIETGMIGKDGQFGAGHALNGQVSSAHVVMQIAGDVSVAPANHVVDVAQRNPEFRKLLLGYEQFALAQAQQTAGCNAVHRVTQRMAKWLLRMHHLAGDEFSMTQEFMAQMLGVRRTSVTDTATELQRLGLITYTRGNMKIHNLKQIHDFACECDDDLMEHYRIIFPNAFESPSGQT